MDGHDKVYLSLLFHLASFIRLLLLSVKTWIHHWVEIKEDEETNPSKM